MSEHVSRAPRTRARRLAGALIALFLAFLCFLVGEDTLERFFGYDPDSVARDAEARWNAALPSSNVVLVTITDADYDSFFAGRSPLNVDTLERIVRIIASGKPSVIGVDLETADSSFRRLEPLAEEFARGRSPRIIWAQDVAGCPGAGNADQGADGSSSRDCAASAMRPLGVLGLTDDALRAHHRAASGVIETGLAVTQLDEHGTVRRYQKSLESGGERRLSFTTAIRRAFKTPVSDDSDSEPRYVRFHRGPSTQWRLSIKQLLNLARRSDALDPIIRGKIVLLGGTYRAARDEHHTPIGMMAGLDVHAQTIDTELDPRGNASPSWLRLVTLRFVFGLALALPFLYLSLRGGLLSALPLGLACCILGSRIVTHGWFAGVGYFLPFLVLVVIFSLYERASHIQHELYEEFAYRIGAREHNEESSAGRIVDLLTAAVTATESAVVGRMRSGAAALRRSMHRPAEEPPGGAPADGGVSGPPPGVPTPSPSEPNEVGNPIVRP